MDEHGQISGRADPEQRRHDRLRAPDRAGTRLHPHFPRQPARFPLRQGAGNRRQGEAARRVVRYFDR